MKKVDKLLLSSFYGPFAVSFGIALFVLILQFLWLYIDEIAGKGVSLFILVELIAYQSISFFPLALPIGVLIASVMVMGNLAERYELSSLKSAGVPLIRIMRSLIVCAAAIGLFSYVCSDFIMPISNLKARTRLFDIRKQKPGLSIEKGVFNDDFRQFIIRVGDKKKDGETIGQIMIEDQTSAGRMKLNKILADSGQMYSTADKRFFVMNLFDGTQYQEPNNQSNPNQKQKFPFIRTHFKSMTKVWDLKEFEMNMSDDDRFKDQRSMLSMNQLRANLDSLTLMMYKGRQSFADEMMLNMKRPLIRPGLPSPPPPPIKKVVISGKKSRRTTLPVQQPARALPQPVAPRQTLNKPLTQYTALLETFGPNDQLTLRKNAETRIKSNFTSLENAKRQVEPRRKEYVKTAYELYTKYSFALVCFIFMFIGAPMGAIIRKGGFGYPILVSIIFFVIFIMMTILCRKFAETYFMSPFWAAMVPCLILMPVGFFLTRKAMNDSQIFNTDRFDRLVFRIRQRVEQRKKLDVK